MPTQLLESATGLPAPHGAVLIGGLAAYFIIRQQLLRLREVARGLSSSASLASAAAAAVTMAHVLLHAQQLTV